MNSIGRIFTRWIFASLIVLAVWAFFSVTWFTAFVLLCAAVAVLEEIREAWLKMRIKEGCNCAQRHYGDGYHHNDCRVRQELRRTLRR